MLHLAIASLALFSDPLDSPFSVPVAGCVMILGIVAVSIWSSVRNREIASVERLAAIAKGVPIPPTPDELALTHGRPNIDTTRRRGNVRRGGMVLVGLAFGMVAFFSLLSFILHVREVLAGAAVALIPLGIGIALLLDARIQSREMNESKI